MMESHQEGKGNERKTKGKQLSWLMSGPMLAALMTPLPVAASEQSEWAMDVDGYEIAQATKDYSKKGQK